jgi:hypothetical protein
MDRVYDILVPGFDPVKLRNDKKAFLNSGIVPLKITRSTASQVEIKESERRQDSKPLFMKKSKDGGFKKALLDGLDYG